MDDMQVPEQLDRGTCFRAGAVLGLGATIRGRTGCPDEHVTRADAGG
jgi:hypothetical protein